jgi:hypothetical protein
VKNEAREVEPTPTVAVSLPQMTTPSQLENCMAGVTEPMKRDARSKI